MNAVRGSGLHSWQLHLSFKPFAISKAYEKYNPDYVFDQIILLDSELLDTPAAVITRKNLPLNCNPYTTTNSHSFRSYLAVWYCVCATTGIHVYTRTFVAQEDN